jgi:hypothetical protein
MHPQEVTHCCWDVAENGKHHTIWGRFNFACDKSDNKEILVKNMSTICL